jgi:D-arabinose 1-dehydrogenase-like Zn-dependent alcohol dehydrogenase
MGSVGFFATEGDLTIAKMRAMVVHKVGGPLMAEERDIPAPGAEEVLIRVQACGVCHSDTLTVQKLLPFIQHPRIPGHEVVGVIEALGSGVKGFSIGERVGVGWFGGNCGYCGHCRRDAGFACENVHEVTGVSRDGGYATHMVALASAMAHFPDDLDPIESAPPLCAGVTTFNALRHTGAGPGDIVAVHGVGGWAISESSSRRVKASARSRSIADETRRNSPASSARVTLSTARRKTRRRRSPPWAGRKRSSPPSPTGKRCRRSPAASAPTAS